MMQLLSTYPYTTATRIDSPDGRKYIFSDGLAIPSVTTILSKTSDDIGLVAWRKRVGEEEAERITAEAAHIGTHMHNNLENYILGNNIPPSGPLISKILAKIIVKKGLCNVSQVLGTEVPLYVKGLYAGTTDLIGFQNGTLSIMDFKNSNKTKARKWVGDYACQLAAYAIAHNDMYGTNIQRGVIMMGVRDSLTYQEFVFEGRDFQNAKDQWLSRVERYYASLH